MQAQPLARQAGARGLPPCFRAGPGQARPRPQHQQDGQGDPCANLTISVQRAQSVARDLGTYGLKASAVQGYGSAAPVASNDTPSGRERNRRVEVWMSERAVEPVAAARCH